MYKSDKDNEVRISAKCHRSQRKNSSPHSLNLDVSSGSLQLAHCSCTAGASGSCSHIIGLLMALQHWILMGFKAVPDNLTCTSLPQQWSVPRGSKIESSATPQICIIKPHPDRKQKPVENVLTECRKFYVNGEDVDHLKALKGLPISYLVSNPMKKKVTHLGEVGIGSGLSTHASFYEPHVQKTVDAKCRDLKLPYICPVLLPDEYKHLSESLAIDFNEAYKIQEETQEQYNSQRWQLERKKTPYSIKIL
ncbi:uncharacterized protein LOC133181207 [Saccostrea echinata]|uniref:uncharacterized protein LOC133181207 n=1 Tax=Saccostrea echinata TaxID=191078 RepID=UPI002A8302EF|nr:uncharacterized protein LOC133181207 [Saccostrea echinata]